jgi:hypothetical protein
MKHLEKKKIIPTNTSRINSAISFEENEIFEGCEEEGGKES